MGTMVSPEDFRPLDELAIQGVAAVPSQITSYQHQIEMNMLESSNGALLPDVNRPHISILPEILNL